MAFDFLHQAVPDTVCSGSRRDLAHDVVHRKDTLEVKSQAAADRERI
jgi:hypothetical protein